MINLEFTQQQVEELTIYYKTELAKIEKRAEEIREILTKFNSNSKTIKTNGKVLQNDIVKTNIITEKKDNESWSTTILKAMAHIGKPAYKEAIYKKVSELRGVDLSKNILNTIDQAIFNLRRVHKKIESISKNGKKKKLYKLTELRKNKETPIKLKKENLTAKSDNPLDVKKTIIKQGNTPSKVTTYNWSNFITKTLEENQRLIQAKELLEIAMNEFKIPENKKNEFRGRLSPALSRMERETKALKTYKKKGITGCFYGLSNWFYENGVLKAKYTKIIIPKISKVKTKLEKSNNSKSIWPAFIINTIKEENKLLQANNIVDIAMSKFNIPVEKKNQARVSIASSISNLKNKRKIIKSLSLKGERGKYFGLSDWFYENGKLKTEYKKTVI